MSRRWSFIVVLALLAGAPFLTVGRSQSVAPVGTGKAASGTPSDIEMVERLLVARREYQKVLEQLRAHYLSAGDLERAKWAEEELRQYHRIPKQAFRLELDVPPPTLQANTNIPEANKLFTRAMGFKDRGWGTDYIDNQRRAELLFQQLLTQYPQSNKISDTAYELGDVYESKAYRQYRRAAQYFETLLPVEPVDPLRRPVAGSAAYDRQLLERAKAIEIYREVTNYETDTRRIDEATKRIADLSAPR